MDGRLDQGPLEIATVTADFFKLRVLKTMGYAGETVMPPFDEGVSAFTWEVGCTNQISPLLLRI